MSKTEAQASALRPRVQQVRMWYFHVVAVNNQCWFDWMQHFWAFREIRRKFWKRRPVCKCALCPNCLFSPTEGLHCYPTAGKACKSRNIEGHYSTGQKLECVKSKLPLFIRSQRITGHLIVFSVRRPHSLDTVSEEVRFVCMHDDHVKEVSPVLSHHMSHSFVPADGKE